jgi:protein tyrosine phosphatase (PTP) superfamily phosphohydrolase (DUF442 family)
MDYSKITEQLYIGRTPSTKDYALLHDLGVTLVINMRIGMPPQRDPHAKPVKSIWLPWIDSPFFPIPMRFLMYGAQEALKTMEAGGAVYTHCAHGRHRGPAMGACILVAQGKAVEAAIQLIRQQRPAADPGVWYVRSRIVKFSHKWGAG